MIFKEQTVTELSEELGITRQHYYRLKAAGKLESYIYSKGLKRHEVYIDEWVTWRDQGLHDKPRSLNYQQLQARQIKLYFQKFRSVTSENLEKWLLEIPPIQLSMRKDRHSCISSFAKYLHHIDQLSGEELNRIRLLYPKKPPQYRPNQRIIHSEDLSKIIEQTEKCHIRYNRILNRTLLIFTSETGLRASEVCNIKVSHVRFSDNPTEAIVNVFHGKGGKDRVVPFSKAAQECIEVYLKALPESCDAAKCLFWSHNPKHGYTPLTRDCIARRFQNLSQATGIPFSAHSLRHYRITQWANNARIPITVTQKWAGHSSLEVTQRYIHIRDEDAMVAAFE